MGNDHRPEPSVGTPLSRRSFMAGGLAGALALGAIGGMGSPFRLSWPEILAVEGAQGPIATFALLDRILVTLGDTKVTLFPFLESTGSILRVRSYGGGGDGVQILVAAGASTAIDPTDAGLRYPYRHVGGIHSLYFHPGEGRVENLHLAGEDDVQYEFPDNAPFSVGAWIYPRIDKASTILAKWDESGNDREWELVFDGETRLVKFIVYDEDNDAPISRVSGTPLEFNRWHFAVGSYDGSDTSTGLTVYADGRVDNAGTTTGPGFSSLAAGAARLLVGASGLTTAPRNVFTGRIALPFICGKQLLPADVALLYGLGGRLLGLL